MSVKNFLSVSVRIKHGRRGFRIWLPPIALFVLHDAVISFDGWLGLIPGNIGVKVRNGSDAIQALTLAMTQSEIDVNVDVNKADTAVKVRVKTL